VRLVYRPIEAWPGPFTAYRKPLPFRATWADTQQLLEQELEQLEVVDDIAILQLALTESDLRVDGSIKVRANLAHPGVILSFESKRHGKLSYPCDTFEAATWRNIPPWQGNVRAIALGLEALRKLDRYGIAPHGEQYTGWKAIGTGIPLGAETMTRDEAARFIAAHAWPNENPDLGAGHILRNPDDAKAGYRLASKALHPDTGAYDDEAFKRLQLAWRTLGGGS
jgi:hypothetical protein